MTGKFIRKTGEEVTLNLLLTADGRWTGDDIFNPPKEGVIKTEQFTGKYNIANGKICKSDKVTHRNGKPVDGPRSRVSCFPVTQNGDVIFLRDIAMRYIES